MNSKQRLKAVCIGMLFAPIRRILRPRKNLWLYGSDKGEKYAQNSKYFFEYVLNNYPEIDSYWITSSPIIYDEMKRKGLPVLNNLSLKGAYYSHIAELKLMSTWLNDILYTYPYQKVAYLMHGMPPKKVYYANKRSKEKKGFVIGIKRLFTKLFLYNYKLEYSCFSPVCSNYFKEIVSEAMRNTNIYVTGQPRTDAFLHIDGKAVRAKYGIAQDAFVITYMPTHRSYGAGEPSPHLFIDNEKAVNYFKNNNIVMIWKQHINMLKKYQRREADSCFKELSFDYTTDPQEILFISDILITDWSSCFIDYLLLHRPILFYHYDDYEKDDHDLYFRADVLAKVGRVTSSEEELLKNIEYLYNNRDKEDVSLNSNIFNEIYDDKSCERCYNQLKQILGKR